jgi:Zn-dependent protease
MGSSIRLGKILGIPIGVNYSWILIFLLFTYLLSSQFADSYPQWPTAQRWSIAVVTSILFFLSVLAHELSHSVVAIRRGIPVRGITLFIFGGVSQLAHEARRPFTEFLVTVVGPLTSILLGLVFGGLFSLSLGIDTPLLAIFVAPFFHNANTPLTAILSSLCLINLSLGVFNMLPGFPLDGGRVLRSAIWAISGNYWRATLVATRAGQLIGVLMIAGGVAGFFWLGVTSLWTALIGGFLLSAATATYRQERAKESLRAYRVADVMTTRWQAVASETPLGSPLVAQWLPSGDDFLAVLAEGQVRGILTRRGVARVPQSLWPQTPVATAMLPLSSLPTLAPEDDMVEALERMENENLDRLAVLSNGVLLGFVSREDTWRLQRARPRSRT